jgi:hypothetical protein
MKIKTQTTKKPDAPAEVREVLLTWSDGQTTHTSQSVIDKFKALYGTTPNCKMEALA